MQRIATDVVRSVRGLYVCVCWRRRWAVHNRPNRLCKIAQSCYIPTLHYYQQFSWCFFD